MSDVVTVKGVTELSGIADPSTSVAVYDSGKLIGTVTATTDGTWTLNTKLTGNGVHSFTELSTNTIGSTPSAGVTVYSASANKVLQGSSGGNDFLIGGHNDTLTGGGGPTEFVFNAHFGNDTITNFHPTSSFQGGPDSPHDVIAIDHNLFPSENAVQLLSQAHDTKAGVVIEVDAADTITLTGVKLADLQSSDFGFF
jgi:Ca2+-binding RTX toxin-like protein